MANLAQSKTDQQVLALSAKSQVFIKCGDCLHWGNSPHPSKPRLCKLDGIVKGANAPTCFTPNVHAIKWMDSKSFASLSSIVSKLSASESRVFIGLLRQQTKLVRAGFSFLELIYLKVGSNHLANYYSGYALGVAPTGEILIVGSDYLNKQRNSIVMQVLPSSLLRSFEFESIRTDLVSRGRINPERRVQDASVYVDYEPPTFETSPEALEALGRKIKKPAKKTKPLDTLEVSLGEM